MVHLYYARRMRLERFVSKAQPLVDHTGASRERQHTLSSEWCVCVFEKGLRVAIMPSTMECIVLHNAAGNSIPISSSLNHYFLAKMFSLDTCL